jgi:ureidoglycolate hydrolase
MNDAATLSVHMLDVRDPAAEAFASYGQVVAWLRTARQDVETHYNPETSPTGANLVPSNGEARVWIIHLLHVGHRLRRIARHRGMTQRLGSLGSTEWLTGVAPPGDLGDDARPRLGDIGAFRIPVDRVIKAQFATWHAGSHFVHEECEFVNLENVDTDRRDFRAVPHPAECRSGLRVD